MSLPDPGPTVFAKTWLLLNVNASRNREERNHFRDRRHNRFLFPFPINHTKSSRRSDPYVVLLMPASMSAGQSHSCGPR